MLVPQRKHDLGRFAPASGPLESNPDLGSRYRVWQEERDRIKRETLEGSRQGQSKWQRHYFKGAFADGTASPEHHTRLALMEFAKKG